MRRLPRTVKWVLGLTIAGALVFTGVYYALYQTFPFMPSPDLTDVIVKQAASAVPDASNVPAARGPGHVLAILPKPGTQYAMSGAVPGRRSLQGHAPTVGAGDALPVGGATVTAPDDGGHVLAGQLRHGTVQKGVINSVILGNQRPYNIYLPPGYDRGQQRYPVLYLLHGAPGNFKDWKGVGGIDKTMDALISLRGLKPMIVVMPDGNGGFFGGDTEWANAGAHGVRAEDYITDEIVPYVDLHYRTLADSTHRAIGGLSSGAFGAVNMTLHHPNLFGYAIGLSGNYLAAATWTGKDLWGKDPAVRRYNSPILYAPSAPGIRGSHIFLVVGATDNLDNTYRETVQFDAVLQKLGVPHATRFFPGKHSWSFWRTHIVEALEYLNQVMPS